jgi:hypothetical protein
VPGAKNSPPVAARGITRALHAAFQDALHTQLSCNLLQAQVGLPEAIEGRSSTTEVPTVVTVAGVAVATLGCT